MVNAAHLELKFTQFGQAASDKLNARSRCALSENAWIKPILKQLKNQLLAIKKAPCLLKVNGAYVYKLVTWRRINAVRTVNIEIKHFG